MIKGGASLDPNDYSFVFIILFIPNKQNDLCTLRIKGNPRRKAIQNIRYCQRARHNFDFIILC